MRVIEADHLPALFSRGAPGFDVVGRIDQIPIGTIGKVPGSNGIRDPVVRSDEQSATFPRMLLSRMCQHAFEHGAGDSHDYAASTTIAIPIPPPMHSDATP